MSKIDQNGYSWGTFAVVERDGSRIRAVIEVADEEGKARLAAHDMAVGSKSGYEYDYLEVKAPVAGLARSLAAGRYSDPRPAIARTCTEEADHEILEPLADFYQRRGYGEV